MLSLVPHDLNFLHQSIKPSKLVDRKIPRKYFKFTYKAIEMRYSCKINFYCVVYVYSLTFMTLAPLLQQAFVANILQRL